MAYDVNASLERLEKNLQDISSAREQVQNTVKASSELQGVVKSYVDNINSILEETILLREELGKIKLQNISEAQDAVSAIESSCASVVDSFRNDVSGVLSEFSSENKKIAKTRNELNAFQKKLEESIVISSELKVELEQTSNNLQSIQHSQEKGFDGISKQSEEDLEKLNQSIELLSKGTEEQFTRMSDRIRSLDRIVTNNQVILAYLKQEVTQSQKLVIENLESNRLIFMVGMIILILLVLFLFIK